MNDPKHNSTQQRELISLFLDQALEPEEQKEFLSKVNSNPNLSAAVEREKQFRKMIKNKLNRPALEPDFIKTLKNKLH